MSLQTLLNIEIPLIQAPMAGVQDSALAVAVCNTGALGSLPCAMLSLDQLRQRLLMLQAQSSNPYNLNFFCHVPPLPQVVQALRIPVIAAGGIADAHGVRAAMGLGAAGVQVGTAYMLCAEASTSEVHRNALKSKDAVHTALTNLFTGRPARGIVNRLMRELGPLCDAAPDFPLATSGLAPLRAKAQGLARGDFSPLWSGQNVSGRKEIGAAELTRALAAGFARRAGN